MALIPVAQFIQREIPLRKSHILLKRCFCHLQNTAPELSATLPNKSQIRCHPLVQPQLLLHPSSLKTLSTPQIRSIKVNHFEPDIEEGKSHSWDGIYGDQIAELVVPKQGGGVVLDLTFGSGKHTEKILLADPNVRVIAIDRDPKCEEDAARLRAAFPKRLCFLNIKHSDTVDALYNLGAVAGTLSGAVLDSGLSHAQLTVPGRGGFFNSPSEPLDLRMNSTSRHEPSAKDILNHIDEDSLYKVLKIYGQNKKARKIARAIIQARYDMQDIRTTGDLHLLIKILEGQDGDSNAPLDNEEFDAEEAAHDSTTLAASFHACTASTFRALRMLVNDELNELDCAVRCMHRMLLPDAPLAVVTYNALEDTIIKRHFTGVDVDTNVNTIGRPQHRNARLLGLSPEGHCKPWQPLSKFVPTYEMKQKFPHWKHDEIAHPCCPVRLLLRVRLQLQLPHSLLVVLRAQMDHERLFVDEVSPGK